MARTVKLGLRILLIALYCVGGAELYLRIFAPQPKTPRYVIAGPDGIRANEPNSHYRHKTAEYSIDIRINSEGMRADEDIPFQKPAGVQRILILGDSFGVGYGSNLKDSFLSIMQRHLEEAGKHVQLVNLSVSGLGPAEQLLILRNEGLKYDPDLVIQCWNITDLDDDVRSHLFALEDGKLVQKNKTYLPGTHAQQVMSNMRIFRWLSAHSDLFGFLRENVGERVKGMLVALRGSPSGDNASKDEVAPTAKSENSYADRLAIAILNAMRHDCEAKGIPFLIDDIPAHWNRYNYWSTFPYGPDGDKHGFLIYSPVDAFNKLKADQVRGYPGEKLYWESSRGHFAPLGNRMVGKGLAAFILDHHLLDKTSKVGPTHSGPKVQQGHDGAANTKG